MWKGFIQKGYQGKRQGGQKKCVGTNYGVAEIGNFEILKSFLDFWNFGEEVPIDVITMH